MRGALLLANHVSWLDILALAQTAGSAFVAHDGLAAFPFLKWLCEMNDTVFIARHDRTSVALQVAAGARRDGRARALTLFPEGTTSDGTGLIAFKSSLLSALEPLPQGVEVQPVALDLRGCRADRLGRRGARPRQFQAHPCAAAPGAA